MMLSTTVVLKKVLHDHLQFFDVVFQHIQSVNGCVKNIYASSLFGGGGGGVKQKNEKNF
jgi:hypothetical protein